MENNNSEMAGQTLMGRSFKVWKKEVVISRHIVRAQRKKEKLEIKKQIVALESDLLALKRKLVQPKLLKLDLSKEAYATYIQHLKQAAEQQGMLFEVMPEQRIRKPAEVCVCGHTAGKHNNVRDGNNPDRLKGTYCKANNCTCNTWKPSRPEDNCSDDNDVDWERKNDPNESR